ncbi:hypothetical protein INT45_007122 [Circinella minor]|uniref:RNA polymerase II-associated protein 1 C-terminal domain-containing protein n=1 Tax=Circinella minor TaxID=1195481 RepID=A0A8H7S548_9FUNG|nr:hypothetical protein INT45_007122 [Circinella minor]
MKRSIRPRFNAEEDDEDLEQLQKEFFEKNTIPSASVIKGGPPTSVTNQTIKKKEEKKSLFAQQREPHPSTPTQKGVKKKVTFDYEDQEALASMPTLEDVDTMPLLDNGPNDMNAMPPLEGVVDPHNDNQPHVPATKKMLDLTSLLGNVLCDVTENQVKKVEPPTLKLGTERSKQHTQGFPKPARRSLFKMRMEAKNNNNKNAMPTEQTTTTTTTTPTSSSSLLQQHTQPKNDYEQDNIDRIHEMTEEEIEAARKEIMDSLSSDSIAMLMNRGKNKSKEEQENNEDEEGEEDLMVMKERYFADVPTEYEKLAWMDSRFDVNHSQPLLQEAEKEKETTTNEEDKMYRRIRFDFQGQPIDPTKDVPVHQGLHHHGDEPDKAGYTLAELFYLVRSQVAPQRTMVLNTLTKILRNAKYNRGIEFWDNILALFLRPDVAGALYLRSAMDDRHLIVLVSAVQAMAALVLEKGDDLDEEDSFHVEQFNEYLGYVARPIVYIKKETMGLDEKFATTVNRLQGKEKKKEEEEELEDDAHLVQRDLTKGLLRMDILARIRYLTLPNSELDSKSIEHLVRILIRLAKSGGADVCQSIMEHDLLDNILQWGVLKRDWPMTHQDKMDTYPSLAAIRLLTVLAQGSRRVAEEINKKATHLLQYLATPTHVACPSLQNRAYALQIETIKLLRILVCYGLVMPTLQDLQEPMMTWLRAGLIQQQQDNNGLDDARAATTISLLEISLHAAADPHKTTPPHAVDWHQPTAFVPVILAILRTREPSMLLDTAVGYFATLASYMDRFPSVDDTTTTADIWKVIVEKLGDNGTITSIRSHRSNSVLRYVQLLGAFASAKTFKSDATDRLASPLITSLVKQVHNNDFLGRLAMGSWAIHVKDRSDRRKLWGNENDYDTAEMESTVASMHMGALEKQLARNMVQLCVLDRLDSKLASTLALFYLQDADTTADYPLLLDHNGPRLQTLVYPDYQEQNQKPPEEIDTLSSITAWVFSPIDEMYHMEKSRLARKCMDSSVDVVAATLEAAGILLNKAVDHAMAIVSLMKLFMMTEELAGEEEREIFWDDRITRQVNQWLDRLLLNKTKTSDAESLESAWRRSSSAHIRQPFYQFYQAFVAQYASVSFGHSGFARLLAYILIHSDSMDYKYLVWSDHCDILSTIKVNSEEVGYYGNNQSHPNGKIGEGETRRNSTALLRAYMSALAENKVEGSLREFAMNELKDVLNKEDVSNHLKRDISDLLKK